MVLIFSMLVMIDTYIQEFLPEKCLTKIKTHVIDIIKQLKRIRSLQKMKLTVGVVFEYDNYQKTLKLKYSFII